MFNTAMHAEFLNDMKDFGFDVTINGFDWRLSYPILCCCSHIYCTCAYTFIAYYSLYCKKIFYKNTSLKVDWKLRTN